jgi:DNA repair protein RadD
MELRDYQKSLISRVMESSSRRILAVLPTGAGKTVCMASVVAMRNEPSCCVAHRQELVSQISTGLARSGVRHRVIAQSPIIKDIVKRHIDATGRNHISHDSSVAVVGIDTLIRNYCKLDAWRCQVRDVHLDEAHHIQPDNKWGKLLEIFPHGRLTGWTATPCRADKKSLGLVFSEMVVGPSMRDLIDRGHLADFKIYGPPPSIDIGSVPLARDGDYDQRRLRAVTSRSRIIGDVVKHYLQIAPGALGMTFCVSVDAVEQQAAAFCAAGVPAISLNANTPGGDRRAALRDFQRRRLLQICSVDLFGEGVDVPVLECISMARATASYPLFVQMFGRPLRPSPGKPYAVVIDHVGNVRRHNGAPDAEMTWSLDAPPKRAKASPSDGVRFCTQCYRPYEPFRRICPHCGFAPQPVSRSAPEHVDGDLTEYDAELLARLRGQIATVGTTYALRPGAAPRDVVMQRNTEQRANAQLVLREALTWWGGWAKDVKGLNDSDSYRLFWYAFGVDVLTAQTLSGPQMAELTSRIYDSLVDV